MSEQELVGALCGRCPGLEQPAVVIARETGRRLRRHRLILRMPDGAETVYGDAAAGQAVLVRVRPGNG